MRGRGKFVDDIKLREMTYLRFVRSPYAHARIISVDTSAAEALPGVVCTITGKEVAAQTSRSSKWRRATGRRFDNQFRQILAARQIS